MPCTRASRTMSRAVPPSDQLRVLPAQDAGRREKLRAVRQQLYALEPEFCSVTYGAGGSTQRRHLRHGARDPAPKAWTRRRTSRASARPRDSVREQLAELRAMGVNRLVALRGDLPSGYGDRRRVPLRQRPGRIHPRGDRRRVPHRGRRAIPKMHPQARSPQADLQAFAAKVRPAPTRRSRSTSSTPTPISASSTRRAALGVDVPIVPGIMPITNSTPADALFATPAAPRSRAGSALRLQGFGDDTASIRAFGLDVVDDAVRAAVRRRRARRCTSTR